MQAVVGEKFYDSIAWHNLAGEFSLVYLVLKGCCKMDDFPESESKKFCYKSHHFQKKAWKYSQLVLSNGTCFKILGKTGESATI